MGIFPGSCWAGPGLRSGSPCRHKCLPGTCLSPVHVQPQPFRGKGFCFSIQHCWDSAWVFFFFLMKQKCCPDRISLPKILKPLGFSSQLLLKADSLTLCSDSSHVLLSFLMVFFPNVYPNPLGNPTPLDPYGWILGKHFRLRPLPSLNCVSVFELQVGAGARRKACWVWLCISPFSIGILISVVYDSNKQCQRCHLNVTCTGGSIKKKG